MTQKSTINKSTLVMRWSELFPRASDEAIAFAFSGLREQYLQPGRYYHVLSHIQEMLEAQLRHFPKAPDELTKAIFLHDLIYDARRPDNEERSAEVSRVILQRLGDSKEAITEVMRLIMLSRDHTAVEGDILGQQLCDLDLLPLGLPAVDYQANTVRVRKEYGHATDTEWAMGRREFIDRFLSRPYIYATEQIWAQFEAAARRNLIHEREQLTS